MAEVTAQLSLDIAKLKAGLEKAKSEIQAFKEHAKAQKISLGVDQGVGQYGPSQMPLPASVRNLFGGIGANGSAGMFGELASSTGMQAGEGISDGMAAGIGGAAGAVVTAFAGVLKKLLGMAEDAAMDMAKAVYHGLEFNYELNNASVGISNVIGQFQGLNKEASKDAAAAALARIVELEPKTAGTLQDLVQGFMATIAASQSAGLSINENITLISKFANVMSNIGMPTGQLPQELRSILSGDITNDSMVAKVLQISNEDVAQWKAAGTLFEELSNKVGKISDAGDSAQVALTSLKSVVDQALGNMTKPLFDELVQSGKDLTEWLKSAEVKTQLEALKTSLEMLGSRVIKLGPEFQGLAHAMLDIAHVSVQAAGGVASLIKDIERLNESPLGRFFHVVRQITTLGLNDKIANAFTKHDPLGGEDSIHVTDDAGDASQNPALDRKAPKSGELSEEQVKAADKKKRALEAIASLEERIEKLRRDSLSPADRLAAIDADRAGLLEKLRTVGGPLYTPDENGMGAAAEAYQKSGDLEKATELLKLKEQYLQLLREEMDVTKKLQEQDVNAQKKDEDMSKKIDDLATSNRSKEISLMSPQGQMQAFKEQLAKSFGFDIKSAADVQRGLKADKQAIEDAKTPEDKLKAQQKYQSDLNAASQLAGTIQPGQRMSLAGEVAGALGILGGKGGADLIAEESRKQTGFLERIAAALDAGKPQSHQWDDPFAQ